MLWGDPQIDYGIYVTLCRITRVSGPVISGICRIQPAHDAVARDLGDDARCGNGHHFRITLDHGMRRTGQIAGQAITVNQQMIRQARQRGNGALHRKIGGLQDIERIDLGRARVANPDHRARNKAVEQGLATWFGKHL